MTEKRFTRRLALQGSTAAAALVTVGCETTPIADAGMDGGPGTDAPRDTPPDVRTQPDAPALTGPFQHGVASGDPFPGSVVLWTRISEASGPTDVEWEIAESADFGTITAMGTFSTDAGRDFTVKVIAEGLTAGTTYYYRFRAAGTTSPIGRTRTAPTGATSRLRFAVAACSSYAHGYFHGYRRIAERADLDAVIHLGDYIYEYGTGEYGKVRPYEPEHEIVSLADYRMRYAQYRRDPDLMEAHRQHPFITTWDDHESSNDAWSGGAENHDASEGTWADRLSAASQAYREWLPFREQAGGQLFRTLGYGDLVELIVLDTRIHGRMEQLAATDPELNGETRQLLGADQETFLLDRLRTSTARWKVICQQVMMANLPVFLNPDQWDGYPAQRRRLYQAIESGPISDVVVLTGDIHSSWGADLVPADATYDPATGAGSIAVEAVAPGITSPGFPEALARSLGPTLVERAPHFKFFDLSQRGYFVLDLDAARCQAAWFHIDDVTDWKAGAETMTGALDCATGEGHWTEAASAAAPREPAPPLAP